jgi:glyoxylase I family protein
MTVLGVEHIDLTASNLRTSRAFYHDVLGHLGFRAVEHPTYVAWSNGHLTLGLREAAAASRDDGVDRYRPGLHHLALRAASRGDVDRLHAFLVERGVALLDAPAEYPEYGVGYYAVFFADPDGIKLEYAHFPWGYWRRAQTDGRDDRARYVLEE